MEASNLFRPIQVGGMKLAHRLGMSPLTRLRATDDHIPLDMAIRYYSQRASTPGTLLISEGTFISKFDGGIPNVPGIYNEKQIMAWRQITDAVHQKGGYIFCQLWVPGRAAIHGFAESEGVCIYSSSATSLEPNQKPPRAMTVEEIRKNIDSHVTAAKNAIAAGFDGIECHGANGYLIDQFTQDCCNKRVDKYGGNIKNRSRFAMELVTEVSKAIGSERVGIRLSPWSTFNAMRMEDPVAQFTDLITQLSGIKLAYLHLVEARITGPNDADSRPDASETLDFAFRLWRGPLLVGGGLTPDTARRLVDEEYPNKNIVAMFGRHFISTPDLPFRVRNEIPLKCYDRATFYTPQAAAGYIDYPFSNEFLEREGRK